MKLHRYVALAAALWAAFSFTASAQAPCAERAEWLSHLEARFGELRTAVGMVGPDAVLELFLNGETGTWTLLVSTVDGMTCLLAAGEAWQAVSARSTPRARSDNAP